MFSNTTETYDSPYALINPLTILSTDLSVTIYTFITIDCFKYFIKCKIFEFCKILKPLKG